MVKNLKRTTCFSLSFRFVLFRNNSPFISISVVWFFLFVRLIFSNTCVCCLGSRLLLGIHWEPMPNTPMGCPLIILHTRWECRCSVLGLWNGGESLLFRYISCLQFVGLFVIFAQVVVLVILTVQSTPLSAAAAILHTHTHTHRKAVIHNPSSSPLHRRTLQRSARAVCTQL